MRKVRGVRLVRLWRRGFRVLGALCLMLASAATAIADTAPADQAQVTVTVLDQTGAVLITASVTLVDPAGTPVTRPVNERGQATFEGLTAGTYQLRRMPKRLRRTTHG